VFSLVLKIEVYKQYSFLDKTFGHLSKLQLKDNDKPLCCSIKKKTINPCITTRLLLAAYSQINKNPFPNPSSKWKQKWKREDSVAKS
jgi:hypothetical protein